MIIENLDKFKKYWMLWFPGKHIFKTVPNMKQMISVYNNGDIIPRTLQNHSKF